MEVAFRQKNTTDYCFLTSISPHHMDLANLALVEKLEHMGVVAGVSYPPILHFPLSAETIRLLDLQRQTKH